MGSFGNDTRRCFGRAARRPQWLRNSGRACVGRHNGPRSRIFEFGDVVDVVLIAHGAPWGHSIRPFCELAVTGRGHEGGGGRRSGASPESANCRRIPPRPDTAPPKRREDRKVTLAPPCARCTSPHEGRRPRQRGPEHSGVAPRDALLTERVGARGFEPEISGISQSGDVARLSSPGFESSSVFG